MADRQVSTWASFKPDSMHTDEFYVVRSSSWLYVRKRWTQQGRFPCQFWEQTLQNSEHRRKWLRELLLGLYYSSSNAHVLYRISMILKSSCSQAKAILICYLWAPFLKKDIQIQVVSIELVSIQIKLDSMLIESRFHTNWSRFVAKVNKKKYPSNIPVKDFSSSHRIRQRLRDLKISRCAGNAYKNHLFLTLPWRHRSYPVDPSVFPG